MNSKDLSRFIKDVRRKTLEVAFQAQVGHVPSALSMIDYLSVLFNNFVDPHYDRVILGKPFGALAYYAIFVQLGWLKPNWEGYGSSDPCWSYCMGRENPLIKFIDDTMGNTLSVACGVAMSISATNRVYVNASDAYFQAGSVWEAIMFAGAKHLNKLIMTVDNNRMQVLGRVPDILDVEPLGKRLKLFGWRTLYVNGYDVDELDQTFKMAFSPSDKPTAVICNTVKGHGVKFMENAPEWHYRTLTETFLQKALEELE